MRTASLLIALALAAPAAFAADTGLDDAAIATAAQLRDRALAGSEAFAFVEGLTTEVGPRQAGTEAEARAREWAAAWLRNSGFKNVAVEPFMMDTWVPGDIARARVTAPFAQDLVVLPLGNSAATPAGGIEAEVVFFRTVDDLRAAPAGSLAGKIAYISHQMRPAQDGSHYGFAGPARWVGAGIAASKGAVATVIKSVGTDHHRNPHTGGTSFPEGVTPIPAGALSLPDAENLERMFARAQGRPVTLKLEMNPRQIGQTEAEARQAVGAALQALQQALAERVKAIEDVQHRVQVERESAVLMAQRIEVMSTKPWREALQSAEALRTDVAQWQQQASTLADDAQWPSVEPKFPPMLQASRSQLQLVWEAFEAALAQAVAADANPQAPLPAVPVWADELRAARGMDAAVPGEKAAHDALAAQERRAKVLAELDRALGVLERELDAGVELGAILEGATELGATLERGAELGATLLATPPPQARHTKWQKKLVAPPAKWGAW